MRIATRTAVAFGFVLRLGPPGSSTLVTIWRGCEALTIEPGRPPGAITTFPCWTLLMAELAASSHSHASKQHRALPGKLQFPFRPRSREK